MQVAIRRMRVAHPIDPARATQSSELACAWAWRRDTRRENEHSVCDFRREQLGVGRRAEEPQWRQRQRKQSAAVNGRSGGNKNDAVSKD